MNLLNPRIQATAISPSASIKETMSVIQNASHAVANAPTNIALAMDKKNVLIGIVTDGDIRRALLKGASITDPVTSIINTNPITFSKDLTPEEVLEKTTEAIRERNIGNKQLDVILTVDEQNRPHDVFPFFELWKSAEVKTRVVSMIGLGYVGLTLGLVLADLGFKVVGVDRDKRVVDTLKRGKSHVHEKGIDALLERHGNGSFFVQNTFTNNDSDIYVICVGTPVDDKGNVQTEPLVKALAYITKILKKDDLVMLRSTVPVGTCRDIVIPYLEKESGLKAGVDFSVAFAPERTVEGTALHELRSLPQVIGGFDKRSSELCAKLFRHLTDTIVSVDSLEAAEMVKLLNNTYRDLTFSFANEVATICDGFNLNSAKVIQAANHGYARSLIPRPSSGTGGYCLTKDPLIFASSAKKKGIKALLPLDARSINSSMPEYVAKKVESFIKKHKKKASSAKIFVIGIAFKGEPETTDMRSSPSLETIRHLQKKGHKNIVVYDPVVPSKDIREEGLNPVSLKQGFKDADAVLVLNDHQAYQEYDIYSFLATMKAPGLFFDGWHLFDDVLTEEVPGITFQST